MYLLLIIAAALFYAAHERLNGKFPESVFRNLNPKFWDGTQSTQNATKLFGSYPVDGKHIAIALMFASLFIAMHLFERSGWAWPLAGLGILYQTGITAVVFIIAFDFFYNRLLARAPLTAPPPPPVKMPGL